jgi:uncharacterized membrane protein (Fun14 family)
MLRDGVRLGGVNPPMAMKEPGNVMLAVCGARSVVVQLLEKGGVIPPP